ncbi:MAG: hypothetical protein ABR946_07920 [Solirubrobacteraceae bacterium]|jgi:hypothetical protein
MRFVLLGEQATGKSSMLVALYGALVNRRAGDLRIVRTVDDVEFLSRGLLAFTRQESLHRTEVDSDAALLIDLATGDQVVSLDIPDRSGELLKHMLDSRVWDPDLLAQVGPAAGAMLFLRADLLAPQRSLDTGAATAGTDEPAGGLAQDTAELGWSPARMPPDARAVDLLQSLLAQRSQRLPLAIIVSAWDRVTASSPQPSPSDWLADNVTLLDQYLASNADRLPHAVFGVSAQGGDFEAGLPGDLVAEDPWDRAYLVGPEGQRDTFAAPILWLLNPTT